MRLLGGADQPFPEGERLGVRVVDAEYSDAMADPEIHDALQLIPQAAPIEGFEIERIDVLVLLGRVLRVLHAAVGPMLEPRRMLLDVRMIGGALERHVHGDFDVQRPRHVQQPVKVLERAELRQDVLVSALGRSDRPGAADIAGLGAQTVVRPLAIDPADGVDGRKVQHVESHFREIRQPRLDILEGAVLPGCRGGRARKQFVPAAEGRTLAIDDQLERGGDGEAPIRIARDEWRRAPDRAPLPSRPRHRPRDL